MFWDLVLSLFWNLHALVCLCNNSKENPTYNRVNYVNSIYKSKNRNLWAILSLYQLFSSD